LNALVGDELQQAGGYIGILAPRQLRSSLHDRDRRAETPGRLRELEADISSAEDDEVFRQAIEIEGFDMRHGPGGRHPGHIRDRRSRAHAQDHALRSDRARPSVVEGDCHCLRRHEARLAHDQLGAALFESAQVDLDESLDHVPLPALDLGHVRADVPDLDAERLGVRGE
jgi:hypothetical protein